jgi:hypothetical protein
MNTNGQLQTTNNNDTAKVNFGGKIEAVRASDGWEEVKGKNANKNEVVTWLKREKEFKEASVRRELARKDLKETELTEVTQRATKVRNTCTKNCCISAVGRNDKQLNVIEEALKGIQGEWELLPVNIDSGAIDSCMPKDKCNQFRVMPSEMSKSGACYSAANGSEIKNYGQRDVEGQTSEGVNATMTFQVADVRGALGSVHRICEAGNRVVFDDEGSYIECKATKSKSVIDKVNGVYYLYLWCMKNNSQNVKEVLGFTRQGVQA